MIALVRIIIPSVHPSVNKKLQIPISLALSPASFTTLEVTTESSITVGNAALITKYACKVKLNLPIENAEGGTWLYRTPDISLKLKQGKPKVTVTPKNAVFYSGTFTLSSTEKAVKGKSYTLQLKVTFKDQADNEKAAIVKYSVKVK